MDTDVLLKALTAVALAVVAILQAVQQARTTRMIATAKVLTDKVDVVHQQTNSNLQVLQQKLDAALAAVATARRSEVDHRLDTLEKPPTAG